MSGTAVIIVAAGRGQRFGAPLPKQYARLGDATVIRKTLEAFAGHPAVTHIQPVIDMDHANLFDAAAEGIDTLPPVAGGATRQASVRAGLKALAIAAPDYVLIHDAARPNVGASIIDAVLAALADVPGAIPALPVVDTLKRANGESVETTVPRDGLWRAQTPQGFRYADIAAAHETYAAENMTDDAALMEAAGLAVRIVPGSEDNIKVTTPDDLRRMEELMAPGQSGGTFPDIRVGSGYDVHRIGPGDGMTLCGVAIPCDMTLIGHSDADVALHAVTDAILGAIAKGDIGSHFPPSDPQWRGASSDRFLAHAVSLLADAGYTLGNVDLTIICERPKIGPHRDAMRTRLAEICGIDAGRVSVKATTTERLGFTGRGEGIAAEAAVTVIADR